jgi:hypothetical protein
VLPLRLETQGCAIPRSGQTVSRAGTGSAQCTPSQNEKGDRKMPTKSIGRVKLTKDATGKTKLSRVHAYDASKKRRIAKSKKVRVKQ